MRSALRPKIPVEVDLAVTVDRTGSSEQFATGIPATFETICKQVQAKAASCKVWLQSHGDLDEGQEPVLLTNGGSGEQAVSDIRSIRFTGGGDPPEHHLDGISTLLETVPWTANPMKARGAILAFMTADSKPLRSGASPAELGARIRERRVLLYLICQPTACLREFCDAAGGLMFQISNSPDPADLQKIASDIGKSILGTLQSGATVALDTRAAEPS